MSARVPAPTDPSDPRETLSGVLAELLAAAGLAGAGEAAAALAGLGSMAAVSAASPARIARLAGPEAAAVLAAHRRAMLFALREAAVAGPVLATRYDLLDYLHHAQAHARAEQLRVFFLDARRVLIAEEVLATGGTGALAIEPRLVLARALELGAAGLVLVHNHPGGDPAPSPADHAFTRRLTEAAATLDIVVHDHLVVARGGTARVS